MMIRRSTDGRLWLRLPGRPKIPDAFADLVELDRVRAEAEASGDPEKIIPHLVEEMEAKEHLDSLWTKDGIDTSL